MVQDIILSLADLHGKQTLSHSGVEPHCRQGAHHFLDVAGTRTKDLAEGLPLVWTTGKHYLDRVPVHTLLSIAQMSYRSARQRLRVMPEVVHATTGEAEYGLLTQSRLSAPDVR